MTTRDATAPRPPLVVFADLDGTLLRHEDYDPAPARAALAELARRGIPVVIASSKTRAEIEAWQSRLGIRGPFISENGGALHLPPGSAVRPAGLEADVAGRLRVRFGPSYPRLREELGRIAREMGVPLRGFGDMGDAEIGRHTGLSGDDLARAREREYDEPFVPSRPLTAKEADRLEVLASARGLRVTRGGRFHHLAGPGTKGSAARCLLAAYGKPPVASLGVGDGPNDVELLKVVDRPVVVARPDGSHAPELRAALPHARFTRGIGPEGFTEAILEHLTRSG